MSLITNNSPVITSNSNQIEVVFPQKTRNLSEALFPLHRAIEGQYRSLPWPVQMQNIVVMTQVCGGRGDISGAAKAIDLMLRLCPTLNIDWVLQGLRSGQGKPSSFLSCNNPSQVNIRDFYSAPPAEEEGDFMITGPVRFSSNKNIMAGAIGRKIAGPVFGFLECGEKAPSFFTEVIKMIIENSSPEVVAKEVYPRLHARAFSSESDGSVGLLPMGLLPGSGVFFDKSRIDAPRSREYCCPSYLLKIQDMELRKDILTALNINDDKSEPDYDKYSFNSGYAHRPASWEKFIDCVAIHERNKHVVIVLNQQGVFDALSTKDFCDQIFTPERLTFLEQKGYGTVTLKGKGAQRTFLLKDAPHDQSSRQLTVIVRTSFHPNDMRQLQLASERLLATGNNSALEAWCARCKLYLYEDVANAGFTADFLQQQVDLAKTVSKSLSHLLALFGGDRRLPERSLNLPLNKQQMAEMEELLNDPNLSDETLQFCTLITTNYSFAEVFEAAVKRAAWHYLIPELNIIEAETMDQEFQTGLISFLKNPEGDRKTINIRALPELGKRVQEAVAKYLLK